MGWLWVDACFAPRNGFINGNICEKNVQYWVNGIDRKNILLGDVNEWMRNESREVTEPFRNILVNIYFKKRFALNTWLKHKEKEYKENLKADWMFECDENHKW